MSDKCPTCGGDLTAAIEEWEEDFEVETGTAVECPHCDEDG